MDVYTATVNVRKIMGYKDIRRGLIPLLMWPVVIYLNKLTAHFRGKKLLRKKMYCLPQKTESSIRVK